MDTKVLLGSIVALALILLPEPITTVGGTMLGFSILTGMFATGELS